MSTSRKQAVDLGAGSNGTASASPSPLGGSSKLVTPEPRAPKKKKTRLPQLLDGKEGPARVQPSLSTYVSVYVPTLDETSQAPGLLPLVEKT